MNDVLKTFADNVTKDLDKTKVARCRYSSSSEWSRGTL